MTAIPTLRAAAALGPLTTAERSRYALLAAMQIAGRLTRAQVDELDAFEVRDEPGLLGRLEAEAAGWAEMDALVAAVERRAA